MDSEKLRALYADAPFKTTEEEMQQLHVILFEMTVARVSVLTTFRLRKVAALDQGIFDLAAQWLTSGEQARDEIIEDIEELLDLVEKAAE